MHYQVQTFLVPGLQSSRKTSTDLALKAHAKRELRRCGIVVEAEEIYRIGSEDDGGSLRVEIRKALAAQ